MTDKNDKNKNLLSKKYLFATYISVDVVFAYG